MGSFNVVTFEWTNPLTHERHTLRVQFKYGDTWQHEYEVGDMLKWDGNDLGVRSATHVVADGCLDGPEQSVVPTDFEVHVVNGRIAEVCSPSGTYDFIAVGETFIVIEP